MKTRDMTLMALFAALTAVGAWISIPIPPVPFTFQVFFVLLAGAVLGSVRGGLSQIVYVLLGAVGLPVFAGGTSGLGALAGPSGGYIFGFVAAAFLIGALSGDNPGYGRSLAAMAAGVVVIYALGLAQLMLVTKMGFVPAFTVGVAKFVPFDLLKAAMAAAIVQRLRPFVVEQASTA